MTIVMKRHLILNLEAPLMAFGGETIDNIGVTRRFPSASMLTGLIANALGWRRIEGTRHQQLQDRLIFAARIDRGSPESQFLTDFQTAQIDKRDKGWTTKGQPEGREGGGNTYAAPHLRWRDFLADMRLTVALRLEPGEVEPTIAEVRKALEYPARPLFIGRKPCLPSSYLFVDTVEEVSALSALLAFPLETASDTEGEIILFWPEAESIDGVQASRIYALTDQRNWLSGLHGGSRMVCETSIGSERFPPLAENSSSSENGVSHE